MILQKVRYHKNFFSGPVGVWSDFYCFLRLGKLQGEKTCFISGTSGKHLRQSGTQYIFLLEVNFY